MSAARYGYLNGCDILEAREKAVRIRIPIDGEEPETHWIPRSQLEDEGDDLTPGDRDVRVAIARWLLEKLELEPDDDE